MMVLYEVLLQVIILLAPINPMLTEEIYLRIFKSDMKSMDLKETESIHLQNWPMVDETKINMDLEDEMLFTKDLIEQIRALKEENKIRMRWPNKRIIIEPKEAMPKLTFPEIVKNVGNVKELQIKESVIPDDKLSKAESKYCNIYLDTSLDDELLSERVINDLIRNIQFTRKKNRFNVGEEINLTIGTSTVYLKEFIDNNREFISEKVSAKNINLKDGEIAKEGEESYGIINICPNRGCSASLKDNITSKLSKQKEILCPYCNNTLEDGKINSIAFSFIKT
jgi:isoleucyl-tRNA synthetase